MTLKQWIDPVWVFGRRLLRLPRLPEERAMQDCAYHGWVPPPRDIANVDLTEGDIPEPYATWNTWSGIPWFAATFNAEQYWTQRGDDPWRVARRAESRALRDNTLTELRTRLFCLYRAMSHVLDVEDATEQDDRLAHALIGEIRDRVKRRAVD